MLAATGGTLAGAAATAPEKSPVLRILDTAPLTVRGVAFKPGERVKLLVSTGTPIARSVHAGPRGGFVARLGIRPSLCAGIVVQAIGKRGSRAMVDLTRPDCDVRP